MNIEFIKASLLIDCKCKLTKHYIQWQNWTVKNSFRDFRLTSHIHSCGRSRHIQQKRQNPSTIIDVSGSTVKQRNGRCSIDGCHRISLIFWISIRFYMHSLVCQFLATLLLRTHKINKTLRCLIKQYACIRMHTYTSHPLHSFGYSPQISYVSVSRRRLCPSRFR